MDSAALQERDQPYGMSRWLRNSVTAGFFLISVFSCMPYGLQGSWGFIGHRQGGAYTIDSLTGMKNDTESPDDILTFNPDRTFVSMNLKGFYRRKGNKVMMKYEHDRDTVVLKISCPDKNYLLLSSAAAQPVTWFYKRIKK